jgi:tripartite-type tricarboxylate transporter receptor subunit TctC
MRLYAGRTTDFIQDATRNYIARRLETAFLQHFHYRPSPSEVRSWEESLTRLGLVISEAKLTDHGIFLEYQLPQSSRRLDVLITGSAASGISSFKDWVDAIRRDPKMRFVGTPAPSGVGVFLTHLMGKTFGVDLQVVAYKGGRPLLTDLLGGQVPASASVLADYLELHRAGRLRVLAQSMPGRSALAPEVPSYTELGYPQFVGKTSFGFFVKAGTPRPLVAQYAKAITDALRIPEIAKRLNEIGLEVAGGTPEEFQKTLLDDRNRRAPIARQAGIKLD